MEPVKACTVPASVDWPPASRLRNGGLSETQLPALPVPTDAETMSASALSFLTCTLKFMRTTVISFCRNRVWGYPGYSVFFLEGSESTLLPSSSPSLTPVGSLLRKRDFNNNRFMMVRTEIIIRNLLYFRYYVKSFICIISFHP